MENASFLLNDYYYCNIYIHGEFRFIWNIYFISLVSGIIAKNRKFLSNCLSNFKFFPILIKVVSNRGIDEKRRQRIT